MQAQIYLITPPNADASFADQLADALKGNEVAALLIQRGDREDDAYIEVAKKLIPVAQNEGCAALLDNMPEAVKKLGADGVHMTGNVKSIQTAVKNLKPDAIVGAGGVHSKHDAMTKGEIDVDYVFFGALAGSNEDELSANELATWWADTFNVPAVCFDEGKGSTDAFEFVAVRESIWSADNPNATIKALSEASA